MGLLSWANKAWSGADFWDKDENKRQRDNFVAQEAQQRQAQPQQPTQQVRQTQQPAITPPKQNAWDKVKDVFDANSAMDQYKRQQVATPAPTPAPLPPKPAVYRNPKMQTVADAYRSGKISKGSFLAAVDSISNPVVGDWKDNMPNTPVEKIVNAVPAVQAGAKAAVKPYWETADALRNTGQLATGMLTGNSQAVKNAAQNLSDSSSQSIIGGVQRGGGTLVTAAMTPYANHLRGIEEQRAAQAQSGLIQNLVDKGVPAKNAQFWVEQNIGLDPNQASQSMREDLLARAGLNYNDSPLRSYVKTGARLGEGAVDIATLGKGSALLKNPSNALADRAGNLLTMGGQGFTGGVLNAAQQDNVGFGDVLKTGVQSAGQAMLLGELMNTGGRLKQAASRPLRKYANEGLNRIAPQKTNTYLEPITKPLSGNQVDDLRGMTDLLKGDAPEIYGSKLHSDLDGRVRDIGKQYGVDLTNGSPAEKFDRIVNLLDGKVTREVTTRQNPIKTVQDGLGLKPLSKGGYVKNPFYRGDDIAGGKNVDPLESLKQEASLYRGMNATEWNDVFNGGVSANKKNGLAFVGSKDDAVMATEAYGRAGKKGNVIVEYKPEARKKLVSGENLGQNTGGSNLSGEYQAKGLGLSDIARVTDENGKVIYEATQPPKSTPVHNQAHAKPQGAIPAPVKPTTKTPQSPQKLAGSTDTRSRLEAPTKAQPPEAPAPPDAQDWGRLMRQADTEVPKRTSPLDKQMQAAKDIANLKSIKDKKAKKELFDSTNEYLGEKAGSKVQRDLNIKEISEKHKLSDAEKLNAIRVIDNSSVTPMNDKVSKYVADFKKQTDAAYKYYTGEKGIKMGYQHEYLPRIYRNPKTGELLNSAEFDMLQAGTARQKGRNSELLQEDWLVSKDPTELLNKYYISLDNAAAGKKYLNKLEKSGLLVSSTEPVRGLRPVIAEGLQPQNGNYYAPKDVADKLNTMFGDNSPSGGFEKALDVGAKINSTVQSFVLSGGVPGTPLNAFGTMQAVKEAMALHPVRAARGIYAGMSRKNTEKLFNKKSGLVKLMADNGVDPRVDYTHTFKSMAGKVSDVVGKSAKAKAAWHAAVDDPTFGRMMPTYQLLHFETVYNKSVKRLGKAKAAELAAQSVRNFYGINSMAKDAFRTSAAKNASGAAFFAPRFREAMVNFWGNNVNALRHPTDRAYRDNMKFMVAAAATYAAMEGINHATTGNWMHDNPDGKKDKLLIPGGKLTDGKYIGVPFLSSIATVPRNVASLAGSLATGNFEEAGKNLKSFASMPLQTAGEVFTNEDYFGQPVYDRKANPLTKATQAASYAIKDNMQPWIREGANALGQNLPKGTQKALGIRKQSPFQTASQAAEAPFRFYDPEYFKGAKGKLAGQSKFSKDKYVAISDKTEKDAKGKLTSQNKYDAIVSALKKNKDGSVKVNDYDNQELKKAVKDISAEFNAKLKAAGLPEIKGDTRTAKLYALYKQKDYSDLEAPAKERTLVRNLYKTGLSKSARTIYGMSDNDLLSAVKAGKISQKDMESVINLDNMLFNKGVATSLAIGNTVRRKLGIGTLYASSKGGRKGGGGKKGSQASIASISSMLTAGAHIKPPTPPKSAPSTARRPTAVKLKKPSFAKGSGAPRVTKQKGLRYA